MKSTSAIRRATTMMVLATGVAKAAPKIEHKTWTDPKVARREDPDFAIQGEYQGDDLGAQVVALGDGRFDAYILTGGLPGAGWTPSKQRIVLHGARTGDEASLTDDVGKTSTMIAKGGLSLVAEDGKKFALSRIERHSPTLGVKPPADGVVLFDGSSAAAWENGKTENGLLLASGCTSNQRFTDYTLHLEFRTPYKPAARGQQRGNSGVYQSGRWETQIMNSISLIPAVLLALALSACGAALQPLDLRCEGMSASPVVAATPALSWRVESTERGQMQSAWQILVASRRDLLDKDQGDLWDSGKVTATRSPSVAYTGKASGSGTIYHWKVRGWDSGGSESPWSEPSTWESAPITPADWCGARWIDDGKSNPDRDEDFYKPDPAPLLRREFTLTKPIVKARLHFVGLGLCYASLNGERLDDQYFDPPWTAFDKRILFRTHDVTTKLREGGNCLGLSLGNGWFNPLPLRMWGGRNIREALATGRPRAIACLVVDHPDGTQTVLTTGPGWTTREGPTLRNSIYLGEERDARLAIPGWDKTGFNASGWKPARVTDASLEPLQPLAMLPVCAGNTLSAVAVTSPSADTFIVDFGTNFTGIPEIDLRVSAGTRMTFRFGELLNKDGSLNPLTSVCGQIKGTRKQPDGSLKSIGGPGAPEIAWQRDVYISNGMANESYRPDFTYHGFRYMEIIGLPEAPLAADCRGISLHSDIPDAGSFSCSNERLNRIQQICRRTFLSNVVSVQSDCPHRERFGYGGDIVATSEAFLMNFDMAGFYAKTVRDWGDAVQSDGHFPDTAPYVGVDYCGVGWAMVHPLLLEQLYQYYGNQRLIEEQLPAAIRWFDLEASKRKNGLVMTGLGDHEALEKISGPVITTPMFIATARRMARLSKIVGNEKNVARFGKMAEESAAAWTNSFLDAKTGKVGGGSQSEQVLALGFGAAPEAAQQSVFNFLTTELKSQTSGPSLTTGIFGTRFLMDELSQRGSHNLAYALADRSTFPSWGWMLENDATTLWENWAGSDNTFSNNHPMFGSVSAWLFRWLGGIQVAPDAVGSDRVLIDPHPVADLTWVNCSHRTVRGLIKSNWSVNAAGTEFDITIPIGTTATVELSASPGDNITESGNSLDVTTGIKVLQSTLSLHRYQIGSGHYRFLVRP